MSQTSSPSTGGRLVLYQQTHHERDGTPISLLPLIEQHSGLTHLYVAALHVNDRPGDITLNDQPPSDARFGQLWKEVKVLQEKGVKVMAMLGGAAKGTYARLEKDVRSYIPRFHFRVTQRTNLQTSLKHTTHPSIPS
jgi:hypothetical protein